MTASFAPQAWWWLSRASGLVAWLAVVASVVWGLLLAMRTVRRRGVPAWLLDLHRYLGTLALVFTGFHLLALVADNYVHFGWRELFIPMASEWKPGPVTWGIVAFYVLCIVQVTSWLMKHMPRRIWHRIHLSSFVLLIAGTVHGLSSGTDRTNRIVGAGCLVGLTWVLALVTLRVLARDSATKAAGARAAGAKSETADRAARLATLASRRAASTK